MCMGIDVSISMKCFLLSSTFAFGVESGFEKHFFPFSRDRNLQ